MKPGRVGSGTAIVRVSFPDRVTWVIKDGKIMMLLSKDRTGGVQFETFFNTFICLIFCSYEYWLRHD
jgi:hypothetical protein